MKILDAFLKSTVSAPKTSSAVKNSDSPEKKITDIPEASTESSRILGELKSQGYTISSEEADRIAEFIESTDGTEEEKLQTVKAALDKGVPLSARSLQSIRASLFKQVFPPELRQALADTEIPRDQAELLRFFAALAEEEQVGKSGVKPDTLLAGTDSDGILLSEGVSEEQASSVQEKQVISWLMKALDQAIHLSDALGETQEKDSKPQPVHQESHEQAFSKAVKNPLSGNSLSETAPTDNADASIQEPESGQLLQEAAQQLLSAVREMETHPGEIPAEVMAQGISLLMKEITPRMAEVKTEFETLRKVLTTELKALHTELEQPARLNKAQTEEKLSNVIEKLDKAILKSDIPLYTSMTAEKKLLNWSSELQKARSLVLEGDTAQAAEIVDRISKGVKELQFQPAKLKVIHRTLQQAIAGNDISEKGLQQRAQQQISRILEPVHTPREVLEAFKAMGLTHESEVVSALGQNPKKTKEDWLPQENLKELLMKLAADTDEKLTTVTGAEKTLNNLTGQQLLSRPEAKPQGQTLFFSIPMEMANRVEDLKIYVQSRKDKGKVDWENCTFYFAVHTEKYGDVGIRFAAARKSVSIQVKCDNQTLRDAVNPLVEDFKQTMWETGYKIAGISYSPLKENKAAPARTEEAVAIEAEGKGLNLKV